MKIIVYLISFTLLVSAPLRASSNRQDSLRSFLEFVGEDSITISRIMDSPEAVKPSQTIQYYLMFRMRLESDSEDCPLEWHYGWDDTTFVVKSAEYLKNRIEQDTALSLIEPCLLERYVLEPRYDEQILLACIEYAIDKFHIRNAFVIPEIYYGNHQELADWQEKRRFYEMIKFILLNPKFFYCFDKETNNILNRIIKESNNRSPYYAQYRTIVESYSDMELARITKHQQDEMVDVLLQGVANGEKIAELTYSFMLLTGQFVEKNEELGSKILSDLLSP